MNSDRKNEEVEKAIATGRRYWFIHSALVIGLSVLLATEAVISWQSTGFAVAQIILTVLLTILVLLANGGRPVRWFLFVALVIQGFFGFYLGGSRMLDFSEGQVNPESYYFVATGLVFLFMAFYLAYSGEIGVFLRFRQQQRKLHK